MKTRTCMSRVKHWIIRSVYVLLFLGMVWAAPSEFIIEVEPNPLQAWAFADVTIKAVDDEWNVDTSYGDDDDIYIEIEGFSYNDTSIELPWGGIGTFSPQDQGMKIFSKGLSIKNPGTYTLTVADVFNTTLQWSAQVEVVASDSVWSASDVIVTSPVSWGIEKNPTVDVIGKTTFPNTPLELFVDDISLQEWISDSNGNFTIIISGLEPGPHSLKVNALDLDDNVVSTSWDIPFTYEVEVDELFLGVDVDPSTQVLVWQKVTVTIRTSNRVTSALLRAWDADFSPAQKDEPWVFTKQMLMEEVGSFPLDIELSVDGNTTTYEDVETIQVDDVTRQITSLDYTADAQRKKADLTWTYEGNIEYFKIKYGTNKENLRLSLTTASPKWTLVLADSTIPYYAQVFPVDKQWVVNGEASQIITMNPVEKVPVCGDGILELGEACDDGNTVNGDGCTWLCDIEQIVMPDPDPQPDPDPLPVCGDGNVAWLEQCDDGNLFNGDGCNALCVIEPKRAICGDNKQEQDEQCDDWNLFNGDGCDAFCNIEIPVVETCYPEGIALQAKKIWETYYLTWAPVPKAQEYLVYRADQAVSSPSQMTLVGKTQGTMFEYPFDPNSETDKWAWYAVEALCPDEVQKQVGDVTAVKVWPERTLMIMILVLFMATLWWRLVKLSKW